MRTDDVDDTQHGPGRLSRRRRGWLNTPVRTKMTLFIIVAAVGGLAAGELDTALGGAGWLMIILLFAAIAGPAWLAQWSIGNPLAHLLRQTRSAIREGRPTPPQPRRQSTDNEILQLAAFIHRHSLEAYRNARTAEHLRRTLDQRVRYATDAATYHLKQMAMQDALTGLGNRRLLDDRIDHLVAACQSHGIDLQCLVMDVDNFKQINDTLGHAAGDQLLALLGNLIRANTRRNDLAIRLGGDEFVVLLPGVQPRGGAVLAHRLRDLFAQHVRTTLPRDVPTHVSIGMASLSQDGPQSPAALLQKADERLYEAKTNAQRPPTASESA